MKLRKTIHSLPESMSRSMRPFRITMILIPETRFTIEANRVYDQDLSPTFRNEQVAYFTILSNLSRNSKSRNRPCDSSKHPIMKDLCGTVPCGKIALATKPTVTAVNPCPSPQHGSASLVRPMAAAATRATDKYTVSGPSAACIRSEMTASRFERAVRF